MVFPGVQKSTWTYDSEARAYYFHRFYKFQPDLNFDNPAVKEEVRKIMGYWLQLGVSGFRVDAVPFVIEETPRGNKPAPKHYQYLREMHDAVQWRSGDGILLGEANILPSDNIKYFGAEGERMHMILNFQVNQHMFYALATGDVRPLSRALLATRPKADTSQWGVFLRTHDEQDLGRLDQAATRARVRSLCAGAVDAPVRPGNSPPAGPHAGGRSAAHRARPQLLDVLCQARPCCGTAMRSGWATTSRCGSGRR